MVSTACKGETSTLYTFFFMWSFQLPDDDHKNRPKDAVVNINNIHYYCRLCDSEEIDKFQV